MSAIIQVLAKPQCATNWAKAAVPLVRWKTTGAREAPLIDVSTVLAKPEEIKEKQKLQQTISVPVKVDLSPISGVPSEHIKTRRVRIHMPPKNAMQSGTNNIHHWQIEFDARERWENPLMGWSSTGDPLSNMQVDFNSKEEAIAHCERNGFRWYIDHTEKPKKERVKSYAVNFAWNKRTRVSTK